jgi:hypothetical protein
MRGLPLAVRLGAMLGCLSAASAFADWKLERHVEPPSYAVTEPENSNLDIDSVVLACEEAADARGLQLQIYLSTEGPLLPKCRDRDRRPCLSGRPLVCRYLRGAGRRDGSDVPSTVGAPD